ncbi:hypothetical protein [Salinibacterium sp. SWN1162]|uniref:hypothetical protein n=1 Tax=Salinibacterium sp. SWN1162 TaxID=2792053 RepID=UPI0018CE536B|nr:hypothetical protein [Salinibacterium sp. SWN1162]MBH0008106.1 hypothetical protein [Salinibacterium sp. SWN1162]
MNSEREGCSGNAAATRGRISAVAASVMMLSIALAGCVPTATETAIPTTSAPSATASPSSTPLPTPDPLIIPGCDTLLPLTDAKSFFSTSTEKLDEQDSLAITGEEIPEIAAAKSDASIAKNCIWGVPNSDGVFSASLGDISEADITALTEALVSAGYQGATDNNIATLEFISENEVGTTATTHVLTGDLWILVTGPSVDLTTPVAMAMLDQVRLANPTRTY